MVLLIFTYWYLLTDIGEETVVYDLSMSDFDLTEEELMEIRRISQVAYLNTSDDDEVCNQD